jgi:pimeloyl-ACP methyl ester carboxylesterase
MNERAFIARLESANSEEFSELLRNSDLEQQRALRAYFGAAKLERLRSLAQRQIVRGVTQKRGNVVIVPGILGSELTIGIEKIWFGFWSIVRGHFEELRMDSAGNSLNKVSATGLLRRYYGELEQFLLPEWNVLIFPFDWRIDMRESANRLLAAIIEWFGTTQNLHVVAHSMGGLVTRSLARQHPQEWAAMGKLLMLGTPNYGSLAITQLYTGMYRLIRVLALVDCVHRLPELLEFCKTFMGTYQMLPRTDKLAAPRADKLFDPATYGTLNPPVSRFDNAREFQRELEPLINPERLIYIAGTNRPTASDIADWERLDSAHGYAMTPFGDGTVPHSLSRLGEVSAAYFVDEEHSLLPDNEFVMPAIANLLVGSQPHLANKPFSTRAAVDQESLRAERTEQDDQAVGEARQITARVQALRGVYASKETISPEEQQLLDLAMIGPSKGLGAPAAARVNDCGSTSEPAFTTASEHAQSEASATPGFACSSNGLEGSTAERVAALRVNVCCGRLEEIGSPAAAAAGQLAIDAIAVGHYVGVQPAFAEAALDAKISAALSAEHDDPIPDEDPDEQRRNSGLIAQFTQRGIVRGELGRPFFIPDPRDPKRLIVIAGIGLVGRFGTSELTVLARELFWSLGRLGKKHLATVLIGSGAQNLDIDPAVRAWLRGAALTISARPDQPHLEELTFVEYNGARAEEIRQSSIKYSPELSKKTGIQFTVSPAEPIPNPVSTSKSKVTKSDSQPQRRPEATRLLVEQQGEYYRFSAMTGTASVPERALRLDPRIVTEFNNSLAAQTTAGETREWGELMFKLLLPQDLRSKLAGDAHIVVACDSNVAQLHWELMVAPDTAGASVAPDTAFLGLSPGITRQLRNNFVIPPEPPPPSNRRVRVLIVADTDYEHPLPGAVEEAQRVESLFTSYNRELQERGSKTRINVESLVGPMEATCTQVLKLLLTYPPYDVLHFSGHCVYEKKDPPRSGWLFTGGLRLTANELSRVDRVPAFVFSNACQSGVTPSRLDLRSPEMAPSFAESFFARGVKNLVCTAWPVADDAAAAFATEMYAALVGAKGKRPVYAYEAMMNARSAIWQQPTGQQSWGAYQHYGNPWFRLF